MGRIKAHVGSKLIAGVFAAIPLAVTVFIVWYVDAKARALLGLTTPFLGILLGIAGLYVLGLFVTSLLGKYFIRLADAVMGRMPGLRELYRTWKQIALTSDGQEGVFGKVALVTDETGGMRMLAFTTGKPIDGDPATCCVFVPASPNPTQGRLYLVPIARCHMVDVAPKEAIKMILSGGNYVPAGVGAATSATPGRKT